MRKEPIRVLLLQGVTIVGGAHQSLILLANTLLEKNVIPIVITSERGAFTDLLEKNNIHYKIVRMGMWRKGKTFPLIPWALYKLYSWIVSEGIDIVHANTVWDNPYALFPSRWAGIPLICHVRSKTLPAMVSKYFIQKADRVISISENLAEPIRPLLSCAPKIIYNGVDTKNFSPDTDGSFIRDRLGIPNNIPLVGIISRIDPLKGQKLFMEAARMVHITHPHVRFVVVGGYGKKQAWFAAAVRGMIASEKFRDFCFYMDYEENVAPVFAALDVSVLPSLEEGLGRTNLEAMAVEKPVISTNVGGIPECVVDGENGFLITYDSMSLANRIRRLVDSPELCRSMGERGCRRVEEHFSVEKYVDGVYEVYKELLCMKFG